MTKQRPQQMISFLTRVMNNPVLIDQMLHNRQLSSMKRRCLGMKNIPQLVGIGLFPDRLVVADHGGFGTQDGMIKEGLPADGFVNINDSTMHILLHNLKTNTRDGLPQRCNNDFPRLRPQV